MYSKSKGLTDRGFTLTPPPGYDGSRFRKRSDGRDDAFPSYSQSNISPPPIQEHIEAPIEEQPPCIEEPEAPICISEPVCHINDRKKEKNEKENPLTAFLQSLKSEDILLIALIILLAGTDKNNGIETILILALLLCIR